MAAATKVPSVDEGMARKLNIDQSSLSNLKRFIVSEQMAESSVLRSGIGLNQVHNNALIQKHYPSLQSTFPDICNDRNPEHAVLWRKVVQEILIHYKGKFRKPVDLNLTPFDKAQYSTGKCLSSEYAGFKNLAIFVRTEGRRQVWHGDTISSQVIKVHSLVRPDCEDTQCPTAIDVDWTAMKVWLDAICGKKEDELLVWENQTTSTGKANLVIVGDQTSFSSICATQYEQGEPGLFFHLVSTAPPRPTVQKGGPQLRRRASETSLSELVLDPALITKLSTISKRTPSLISVSVQNESNLKNGARSSYLAPVMNRISICCEHEHASEQLERDLADAKQAHESEKKQLQQEIEEAKQSLRSQTEQMQYELNETKKQYEEELDYWKSTFNRLAEARVAATHIIFEAKRRPEFRRTVSTPAPPKSSAKNLPKLGGMTTSISEYSRKLRPWRATQDLK